MRALVRGTGLAVVLLGCQAAGGKDAGVESKPKPAAVSLDPVAENYIGPELPRARVVLADAFGGKHSVSVEVAATGAARERGLMWRTTLADGSGMLFIFPRIQVMTFWMKNTLIPLDMLFVTDDGVVAGVVENAEPRTLSPRGVPHPSLYVLEVPGGWAARVGIKAGAKVELDGVSTIDVKP